MKRYYRIIDNMIPSRNVAIEAKNKNDAMDWGASLLKTCNIRVIILKHPPKYVDYITPDARPPSKEYYEGYAPGIEPYYRTNNIPLVCPICGLPVSFSALGTTYCPIHARITEAVDIITEQENSDELISISDETYQELIEEGQGIEVLKEYQWLLEQGFIDPHVRY